MSPDKGLGAGNSYFSPSFGAGLDIAGASFETALKGASSG